MGFFKNLIKYTSPVGFIAVTAAETVVKKKACEYALKNGCPPEKAVKIFTEDDATTAVAKAVAEVATHKQEMHG